MDDKYVDLNLAHFSMQFKDTKRQVQHDAKRIFSRDYDWITGTEAGNAPVKPVVISMAQDNDYAVHTYKSNWVAIHKSIVTRGSITKLGETVVDNSRIRGNGHDLNICGISFDHKELGEITVTSSHFSTRGRPTANRQQNINLGVNQELARSIGEMAKRAGAGKALFFHGSDTNIPGNLFDPFLGAPMTPIQEELNNWQNTGHGPIDTIAKFDKDHRVKGRYVRVLTDKKLFLFTDHYGVEAGYRVRLPRGK